MNDFVVIRGAGDIASGIAARLFRVGFKVLLLECLKPSSIRTKVCFSQAVYDKTCEIEGIKAKLVNKDELLDSVGFIPIIIDENLDILNYIKPRALIDAILAKKNLGTNINMAPVVIAIGPGFCAGIDAHAVIESNRGHNLGKVILSGFAEENTAIPAEVKGIGAKRVIYANDNGNFKAIAKIGDIVKEDEIIAYINNTPVKASINGLLRGIINDNFEVKKGLKIADIDPRISEYENCFSISDKARSIGGGVLEALMYLEIRNKNG